MGVLDWFKSKVNIIARHKSDWREYGGYNAVFTPFGQNMWQSQAVRACIRPLAMHTSKANAKCNKNPELERLLNLQPNVFMSGADMLQKVRTMLELKNTAFIYINRDDKGKVTSFYPVPYFSFTALEYRNDLFVQFDFKNGKESIVLPWRDLIALRKDYNESDIAGDSNKPIFSSLELLNTTDQGAANAIKATANLRGILKNTKGMLDEEDLAMQKDKFVKEYLNLNNEGGIASLDSTQEFTPIKMEPTITSWETRKEYREDIQRYFGVSNAIITGDYTETQMEAFYESCIEPFLVALSLEMTRKVFTEREIGFGNEIVYESNRIQYASTTTKLSMVALVDRGMMTPNEYRALFNMAPFEGGNEFVMRLDTAKTGDKTEGEENGS